MASHKTDFLCTLMVEREITLKREISLAILFTAQGALRISSDGDDRRTFWGLKFLIPGFFWIGKFGWYFLDGLI